MDQEQSSRWLEALNQEKKSRQRWQQTYMTSEELEQMREDEATLMSQSSANRANRRINHQEAMEMRLANVSLEAEKDPAREVVSAYQKRRALIAEQVAAARPRSHHITKKTDTASLLQDIGPGLWVSVNPAYTHQTRQGMTSTQHLSHPFEPERGWGEYPDKAHHLKQDPMMAHANKVIQLGEKPFKSGGMKLNAKPGK